MSVFDDYSIYEKRNNERLERAEGFALGRVTRVYEDERLCEVKTFAGLGSKNDNHIAKCQWLSADANFEGDESTVLPRANSLCLVAYINGEPFIVAFFNPLSDNGSAKVGDRGDETLYSGDRIMKTSAGNKVILRTNGIIQIQSTDGNSVEFFPTSPNGLTKDLIKILNKNLLFETTGGSIDWIVQTRRKDTIYASEYKDKSAPAGEANSFVEKIGEVIPGGGNIIHTMEYGKNGASKYSPTEVVKTTTVLKDGETTEFIRAPGAESGGLYINKKPTGETTIRVNDKTTLHMDPSGKVDIVVNNGQITIDLLPDGKTTVKMSSDISMDVGGKADIKIGGATKFDIGGKTDIKVNGIVNLDASGKVNISGLNKSATQAVVCDSSICPVVGLPMKAIMKNSESVFISE